MFNKSNTQHLDILASAVNDADRTKSKNDKIKHNLLPITNPMSPIKKLVNPSPLGTAFNLLQALQKNPGYSPGNFYMDSSVSSKPSTFKSAFFDSPMVPTLPANNLYTPLTSTLLPEIAIPTTISEEHQDTSNAGVTTEQLPCGRCALVLCEKCVESKSFCHTRDTNRIVCRDCCRAQKSISISGLRVLGSMDRLSCRSVELTISAEDIQFAQDQAELYKNSSVNAAQDLQQYLAKINKGDEDSFAWLLNLYKFSPFYSDFAGTAHCFDLWDALETTIWEHPLPVCFLYVFLSPVHAAAALRLFPSSLKPLQAFYDGTPIEQSTNLTPGTLKFNFQICSQCNTYAVKYPERRTPNPAFLTQLLSENAPDSQNARHSLMPNFYSDCLCLKPTPSHQRKYRGARKNILINNPNIEVVVEKKRKLTALDAVKTTKKATQEAIREKLKESTNIAQARVRDAVSFLGNAPLAPSAMFQVPPVAASNKRKFSESNDNTPNFNSEPSPFTNYLPSWPKNDTSRNNLITESPAMGFLGNNTIFSTEANNFPRSNFINDSPAGIRIDISGEDKSKEKLLSKAGYFWGSPAAMNFPTTPGTFMMPTDPHIEIDK